MLLDSHAHLDNERFQKDQDEVIERARQSGVKAIVNAGACMETSAAAIALAEKHEFIYAAVGVHPHDAVTIRGEEDYRQLADWTRHPKVVAIGEIGLDYYYDHSPRDVQQQVFARQIALARQTNKPIIIHDRDAHGDVMNIIRKEAQGVTGVLHCFSGSVEMMREVVKLGFFVALGGTVTFANSAKAREVAQAVPLERLLIETDCPYLTPQPYRGRRNEPSYVRYVAAEIAALRGMTEEEVGRVTAENACRLFGISLTDAE